ncbi:hypothetical protein E3O42_16210 [Cryobacterium adonitolivorans]|uniref:Methyltransferase n=1 Tax=Cryobacterium adonitolivorans TaxID=1259189 RepID=A0A4R8W347_9MICO|nr:hypothetical protein E3O42_16210 [Cryobacterium adonitolivorans]
MGMPSDAATLINADIRDYLSTGHTGEFDGVISDAPYGLGITADRRSGSHWDTSGIAFDPSFWSALRQVVRPGGNLASFGHSRTGHRQATAIEDGGWRIVDSVAHVKSHGFNPGNRGIDTELNRTGFEDLSSDYTGYTSHLKPAYEPITLARNLQRNESLVGAIANGGTGGFHTAALRIPTDDLGRARTPGRVTPSAAWSVSRPAIRSTPAPDGRHPTNILFEHARGCVASACSEDCGLRAIDEQGRTKYADGKDRPSRFFSSLKYAPRAPLSERPRVNGVSAPTVKSQALLEWLCTLVGVKHGTTWLDPFCGSGAVAEAVVRAGGRVVSVDLESSYVELARARFRRLDLAWEA